MTWYGMELHGIKIVLYGTVRYCVPGHQTNKLIVWYGWVLYDAVVYGMKMVWSAWYGMAGYDRI